MMTPSPPQQEGVSFTMGGELYSVKWNRYQTIMTSGLVELLEDEEWSMTDVTLACEGEFVTAHKIVLALSSPFFKKFFKMNRVDKAGATLIALANMKFKDLKNIIHFIYHGEVNLENTDLGSFLEAAHMLEIQGLSKPPDMAPQNQISSRTTAESSSVVPSSSSKMKKSVARPPPVTEDSSHSTAKRFCPSSASIPVSTISHHEVTQPISVPVSNPSTSLEGGSLMISAQSEEEEEEEEMISIEDVKPALFSVYSVDDSNNAGYSNDGSQDFFDEGDGNSSGNHDNPLGYPQQLDFSEVQNLNPESFDICETLGIGSNAAGPSQSSQKTPSDSRKQSRSTRGECDDLPTRKHGDAGEIFDSESQSTRCACLCGKTYSHKSHLLRHILVTKKKYQVSCEICGKTVNRKSDLRRHQKSELCKRGSTKKTL